MVLSRENGPKPRFGPVWANFGPKNRATSPFIPSPNLTSCQKSKKSYGGKYANRILQTDRQTEPILEDPSVGPKSAHQWLRFSAKVEKPQKMTVFLEFLNDPDFFSSKIGLRYFLPLNVPYLHAKFQVDPMVGSIITLRHIHTYRRTDGRTRPFL